MRDDSIDTLVRDYGATASSGFGLALLGLLCSWLVAFRATVEMVGALLAIVTVGVPALGLVWAGFRLGQSNIEPTRYGRIVRWTVGCSLGFFLVNAVIIVTYPWYDQSGNLIWGLWSITTGGVGGFVIGFVEARAIQREVEATAASVRAEQLAGEREVLEYLNDLLRHEVLNSAQIIDGHASLVLADDPDDRTRERLETIRHESDALTDVIDDVRGMLEATRQSDEAPAIDLSVLLTDLVDGFRVRHPDADIDLSTPPSVMVVGNDGLAWLFGNLLENAIEHNDSETARVAVTVEPTEETVVVSVTDNGPGIDAESRDRLFERKSRNHGLGLYLVRVLADRYEGSVDLTASGTDGTTIAVTLRRVDGVETDKDPTERTHRSAI
ncbi:GHKL domain-containing protein [Salinadaptatus halalkaliphilus]|uniref:histidine kinase n=1 Tax=Salinadaptatus halalkaliphilus TaxID=2419781 RepID=A0A4S3TI30_9EURY|nr:ATP-binding protein [Salinadaptatus halalkaliphilus]THE62873.1 GHKL domain-containing protein [Salinadaptatus halalkaliphilus]